MGNYAVTAGRMVPHNMVTTQFELDGFRVVRTLGVVREIVVRSSRSSEPLEPGCKRWSAATSPC